MKDKIEYAIGVILSNESPGFYDTTMRFRFDGIEWYIYRNYAQKFCISAEIPADKEGVITDVDC
mgnify:FL=1